MGRSVILLVDNSPLGPYRYSAKRFRKLLRQLSGEEVRAVSFGQLAYRKVLQEASEARALVLGGFGGWIPRRYYRLVYRAELRMIRRLRKPMLGVCGGHQLLAVAFHGEVEGLGRRVRGFKTVQVVERDPIFEGVPDSMVVRQHHHDQVSRLPEGFKLLATSSTTKVEAMKHVSEPLYGLQFHPERFDKAHLHGRAILSNFLRIAST
ncbi:MAG: gamma-glutamyl-gamma-aminobutyrate hydrolase family protein [Candidatus Bathyarchaeia archaeon]